MKSTILFRIYRILCITLVIHRGNISLAVNHNKIDENIYFIKNNVIRPHTNNIINVHNH